MTNLTEITGFSIVSGTSGSFKNKIINGNFDIWQRGTSGFTSSDIYTADRWFTNFNGSGGTREVSRQAFTLGQTDVPNEPTYFVRINQSVAATGQTYNTFVQRIEDVRTFAGKTVTVSFYAKASTSETLQYVYLSQDFGTGGSSDVNTTFITDLAIGTSWEKYTYSLDLPSISGKTLGTKPMLMLIFSFPINETFQIDIAQVQLEKGSTATDFEMRHIQQELALCQRYYEKSCNIDIYPSGMNTTTSQISGAQLNTWDLSGNPFTYKVTKRSAPTVYTYSPVTGTVGKVRDTTANADLDSSSSGGINHVNIYIGGSGTQDNKYTIHWIADAEL